MKKEYTSATLKYVAMFTMLIDHIGACVIQAMPLYLTTFGQNIYALCRFVGRIAFPLYCFLMVEAFLHTRNRRRYFLTLVGLAILTEPMFDFAMYDSWNWLHQNVLFTFLIGFALLWVLERIEHRGEKISHYPAKIGFLLVGFLLPTLIACLVSWKLQTDYSYTGILLLAVFYLLRNQKESKMFWSTLIMCAKSGFSVVASTYLIYRYNGKSGELKIPHLCYRLFYPIHLLALFVIRRLLLWG